MAPNKYDRAEQIRQTILDVLHLHPGSAMSAVKDMLASYGIEVDTNMCSAYLARMEAIGEARSERRAAWSEAAKKRVSGWFAVVEHTVTAADVMSHLGRNLSGLDESDPRTVGEEAAERLERLAKAKAEKAKANEPWKTVHIGGCDEFGRERGPLRDQGGQGAVCKSAIGSGMYGGAW